MPSPPQCSTSRRPRAGWVRYALWIGVALLLQAPAYATFHFARIVEISRGTSAYPDAHYVILMPYANFQDLFSSVEITVFDADGSPLPNFATFAANLPSTTTSGRSILVATAVAADLLGITPDQTASGTLPASGVICFRKGLTIPDCVSYGAYTGSTLVGGSEAGPPGPAVPPGMVLRRDLGADGVLQATDDTNNSSADFEAAFPAPRNFAGTSVSELTVTGDVTLSWTATAASYSVHKSDDPSAVRGSLPVSTGTDTTFVDPFPDEYPDITFYVVKP